MKNYTGDKSNFPITNHWTMVHPAYEEKQMAIRDKVIKHFLRLVSFQSNLFTYVAGIYPFDQDEYFET